MADPWAVQSVEPADPWTVVDVKPTRAQPKRSLVDNITGAVANVNRGLGIGDELMAGVHTVRDVVTGQSGPNIVQTFKDEMGGQRGRENAFSQAHPNVAALARGTGMAATAVIPAGDTANAFAQAPRVINAIRGATTAGLTGAAYAAADAGTPQERLKAAGQAATNPLVLGLGAVGGALATPRAAPKPNAMTAAPKAPSDAQTLADIGVSTSIPQKLGNATKGLEDLAKRTPILGQAVSGYRDRQLAQLNRGVALKALEPVDMSIPKDVKPGFEMVQHVDDALSSVYNRAANMVPKVHLDQQLADDWAAVGQRRADLAESDAKQFDSIVKDRLARLSSDVASGAMVKQIHSELGTLQAEAAKQGKTTLASMLGETRQSLMGLIARASPEAGQLIAKADKGWRIYSMMNDAAAAASNRGGVFLPGQLNTQVRSAGKSMGSNMTGKGKAPLQDIATAAARMIPDTYGNPGTANVALLSGGGVGLVTAPGQTLGAAAGLTAAATPYFLMGRKVLETLPARASRAQLQAADQQLAQLAAKDPAVLALRHQVAARLSGVAGAAGAGLGPQNALATANPGP